MARTLYRLPKEGKLAGVAAGFADYFEIDVTLVRLLFVAAFFISAGFAFVAYIVLALVLPTKDTKKGSLDIEHNMESLAEEMKASGRAQNVGNYAGIGLVIIGTWLLLGQLFPGWFSWQWSIVWPIIVILLGVLILAKGRTK